MALGPRHDLMISATLISVIDLFPADQAVEEPHVFAAVMFDSCALRPVCLSPD